MPPFADIKNHQIRLASRPVGTPDRDTFPETPLKLFNGENFGKLVLQVAD